MSNSTVNTVTKVAEALVSEGAKSTDLEAKIEEILNRKKAERLAAAKAEAEKEPDWANLTEEQAYSPAVRIPIIDHDIPDYMNVKLKDQEYVAVWANKDPRRLGALIAEGYEMLRSEHVHPDFKLPLKFNSDGIYDYYDVVCMRVHKRILFSKRRKALEISQQQLKNTNKPPKSRFTGDGDIDLGPGLSLYDAQV